jgi:hypothetical protein
MSREPYIRRQSDTTVPIDRSQLPPISVRHLESVGIDPSHPETQELLAQNQEGSQDRETLVRCPACLRCALCRGEAMVSPARAAAWADAQTALTELDEPGT